MHCYCTILQQTRRRIIILCLIRSIIDFYSNSFKHQFVRHFVRRICVRFCYYNLCTFSYYPKLNQQHKDEPEAVLLQIFYDLVQNNDITRQTTLLTCSNYFCNLTRLVTRNMQPFTLRTGHF